MGVKSITSGGSTTPEALLATFRSFITDTTNAWTETAYGADGDDATAQRFAFDSPSGNKFVMLAADTQTSSYNSEASGAIDTYVFHGFGLSAYTGTYAGGTSWHLQSGYPAWNDPALSSNLDTWPVRLWTQGTITNYWLYCFQNPDMFVMVVEDGSNNFWYCYGGNLKETTGSVTGGTVFGGSDNAEGSATPSGSEFAQLWNDGNGDDWVNCDVGSITGSSAWWGSNTSRAPYQGQGWRLWYLGAYANAEPNQWNGIPTMFPCPLFAEETTDTDFVPLGTLEFMRPLDIEHISEKALVTVGSQQWRVFPNYKKGGLTLNHGFAVLEVES